MTEDMGDLDPVKLQTGEPVTVQSYEHTELELVLRFAVPRALAKAAIDEFVYAVGLRDGTVIQFDRCEFQEGNPFVRLIGVRSHSARDGDSGRFSFDRGVEVRITEIAWAADAPYGS